MTAKEDVVTQQQKQREKLWKNLVHLRCRKKR